MRTLSTSLCLFCIPRSLSLSRSPCLLAIHVLIPLQFMLTAAAAYQQQEEHISLSSAADPRVSASPRPTRPQRNSIKTLSNTSTPVAGLPHAGSQAATRTISAPATSSPLHDNKGVSSSSSTRAAPPRPPRQSMRQHSRSFSDADGRAAHVAAGRTTELAGPKHGGHETAHRRSSSYDSHNIAGQIEDMRLEGKRELGPNGTQMETQARGEMANNTLFLKGTFKIKLELVADLKLQKVPSTLSLCVFPFLCLSAFIDYLHETSSY